MTNRSKPVRITSPVGIAKWVFVTEPSTKFKPEGEYNVTVVLDAEAGEKLDKQLSAMAEEARKEMVLEAKKPAQAKARQTYGLTYGLTKEADEEGEETGNWLLKAKKDASFEGRDGKRVETSVPIFDAKKNPAPGVKIGKGSKIRVAFDARPYAMDATKMAGLSLRLAGVQVIDLVEPGGGASADACGFENEDGFEASVDAEPTPSTPASGEAVEDDGF